MVRSRLRNLAMLAGILTLAVVLSATVSCASQPAVLPNGTYTYTICAGCGRDHPATSTLLVSRVDGSVLIEEHASPMEPEEDARRVLDATTFATQTYTYYFSGKPKIGVSIANGAATLRDGSTAKRIVAPAGSSFVVGDLVGIVGFVFQLPAVLHTIGATHLTVASIDFYGKFEAKTLSVSPATASRPANVPPGDVSVAVTFNGETGTLWYDPQTFILDEFDLPASRIVIARGAKT